MGEHFSEKQMSSIVAAPMFQRYIGSRSHPTYFVRDNKTWLHASASPLGYRLFHREKRPFYRRKIYESPLDVPTWIQESSKPEKRRSWGRKSTCSLDLRPPPRKRADTSDTVGSRPAPLKLRRAISDPRSNRGPARGNSGRRPPSGGKRESRSGKPPARKGKPAHKGKPPKRKWLTKCRKWWQGTAAATAYRKLFRKRGK